MRPAIANNSSENSGYETIFLGLPVWRSECPMIVWTFLDAEELADKTLIFLSHNSSELWLREYLTKYKNFR
ncbi:flavodoxin [Streptococcus caballi]|uniref:flavodoxin n=1 Tax=Streptococcus caballi TaxID=439220 RepID=UPI000A047B17